MVSITKFSRRFRHCFAAWPATLALGAAALALGGCGVDRTGLEMVLVPDDAGTVGRGDAIVIGAAGGHGGGVGGSGGSILGSGGAGGISGEGGSTVVEGSGGHIGAGGVSGSGGMMNGAGGMMTGSGGMMLGSGGMLAGTGGMMNGAGGMMTGSGGMMLGVGGTMVGTGGSADGGFDASAGGSGGGGNVGGLGGNPGTGGVPGLGGAGGATICTPACGPCLRCSASHTCEVDPASLWDLLADSAALKAQNPRVQLPATQNWDLDSGEIGGALPDPFVELDFLTTAFTPIGHTTMIVDTLLPNWGALLTPTAAMLNPAGMPVRAGDLTGGTSWQIAVYDADSDTAIGPFGETMCKILGPLTSADFVNGSFTVTNIDSCVSVSIKLTCHP
jgi:hypothetical protein